MSDQSLKRIPFSAQEEGLVRGAAMWMRGAGVLAVLSGTAFTALILLTGEWTFLLSGPPAILLGILLNNGAKAIQNVADTDDADQRQVVIGLENIRVFFLVKCSVVGCGLVLVFFHALSASIFN